MTKPNGRAVMILMADDDADDRDFALEALRDSHVTNDMQFVVDGEDLMDYLRHEGRYGGPRTDARLPGLILLDLNMPKKDGRAALAEIKGDPNLRHIPIVVLTTSVDEQDVVRSYDLGVSSFITKPVTFGGLVEAMRTLRSYWLELVELPSNRPPNGQPTLSA